MSGDSVQEQYETWMYPRPVDDLPQAIAAGYYDRSCPHLFRRKLWPKPIEAESLNILVAGCGTNQAAYMAYRNPQCQVTGIDISEPSLDHHRRLQKKHRLQNLQLQRMAVEDSVALGQRFDLIVCTGVLHHLSDPATGLQALRQLLNPHGVISVMLYGRHSRYGVYMMQDVFRLLGFQQTPEDIRRVKETLANIPPWHHVRSYLEDADDLNHDAGVVDTFLHPQDRAFSVPEILQFAEDNGLKFRDWLDRAPYSPYAMIPQDHPLFDDLTKTERETRWHLIELLAQRHSTHHFLLCHPNTPEADYRLCFTDNNCENYIPSLRPPAKLLITPPVARPNPPTITRNGFAPPLSPEEAALLAQMDGHTPIRDLVAKGQLNEKAARAFFARMADMDHVLFEIPR